MKGVRLTGLGVVALLFAAACQSPITPGEAGPDGDDHPAAELLAAPPLLPPQDLHGMLVHDPVIVPVDGYNNRLIERGYGWGIADIRYAALTADGEDGWVFIRKGAVGYWKDIGVDEGATHASFRLRLDDPDMRGAEELVFVHLHPSRRQMRGVLVPLYQSMEETVHMTVEQFWYTIRREDHRFRVPPSLADFRADALFLSKTRKHGLPPMRSQVVTALGTYTYRATPELQKILLEDETRATRIWDTATENVKTMEELLTRLRAAGFGMTYEPVGGDVWNGLKAWFVREWDAYRRSAIE